MEVAEVKLLGLNEITEAPYPFLKTLISFHFLTFCLPWISSKNDGCRVIKQVIVSKLQVSVLSVGAQLPYRGLKYPYPGAGIATEGEITCKGTVSTA